MPSPRDLFDQLNTEYSAVHKTKEDLFWSTYMATSSDDAGFARAEEAYKNFISDPARLAGVRSALASLPTTDADEPTQALRQGLQGWLARKGWLIDVFLNAIIRSLLAATGPSTRH